jgi:hypothetical protein
MADDCDMTDAKMQVLLDAQIESVRGALAEVVVHVACLFCGDATAGVSYCSQDCRVDHGRELGILARQFVRR